MKFAEPTPYREKFPAGTNVRIADFPFLELFMKEWKYHHKISPEYLKYAGQEAMVRDVAFYHGGDPVYVLKDMPGTWLEQCLRPA
jgi:hypothetical protein